MMSASDRDRGLIAEKPPINFLHAHMRHRIEAGPVTTECSQTSSVLQTGAAISGFDCRCGLDAAGAAAMSGFPDELAAG